MPNTSSTITTVVENLADAVAVVDPCPSTHSFNASDMCLDPDLATSLDPPHRRLKQRCLSLNGPSPVVFFDAQLPQFNYFICSSLIALWTSH
jgi:hypothetical protein